MYAFQKLLPTEHDYQETHQNADRTPRQRNKHLSQSESASQLIEGRSRDLSAQDRQGIPRIPQFSPMNSRQWLTSVAVSVPDERPHRQAVEPLQRAAAPVWRPTRAGRAPAASAGTACPATAPRATRRSPALVRYTERGGRRVDRRPGAGRGFERPGGSFASVRIETVAQAGHRPRRSARTFIENEQAARWRS